MNKLTMRNSVRWCIAALLAVAGLFSWNTVGAANGNLSEKDRQEITVLIYNYSYMFDSKNLDGFLNLFSQDAIWEAFYGGSSSPGLVVNTPDEMRQAFGDKMQQYAAEGIQSRHFMTNIKIYRTGAKLAEGNAMCFVTHQAYDEGEATAVLLHTLEYRYQFVKTQAGWKFRSIEAHTDHS
ncbi:MAG: nuclear transport factor 2 family protein [Bacteroidales bacterium]